MPLLSSPIHSSEPVGRNLWSDYAVYSDRIVLRPSLFLRCEIAIPAEEIVSINMFDPWVFLSNPTALKLDLADLYHHVCIRRRHGFFKKLCFTPDDPEAFIAAAREMLGEFN